VLAEFSGGVIGDSRDNPVKQVEASKSIFRRPALQGRQGS
jgi:hypothetical protein